VKKLIIICVTAGLMFAVGTPVANGSITYGTPSPSLSPTFGTLVNFDDKATGTQVLWNDYVSVGVASITELTGAGSLFKRYSGAQSPPNYIGTGGTHEIGGASGGNNSGGTETFSVMIASAVCSSHTQ